MYRRWEKRGQEGGLPSWRESGESGKIMQHGECLAVIKSQRGEPEIKGYGPGEY